MKKTFFAALFFLLLANAAANADSAVLNKLLETAAANSPAISAAAERASQARAGVAGAAAQMGPSLAGEVYGRRSGEPRGQGREAYSASLNLAQTLYAGGALRANKAAAGLALSAARAEGARACQEVLNSVRESYYETLRAAALLGVAEESLGMSKEHLRQTEALYKGGMVPRGDVLRVKVSVSQAEQDRISAEGSLDMGFAAIERAVGAAIQKPETLREAADASEGGPKPPHYAAPGNAAALALAQRPELAAYEFYRQRAGQLAKAAKGQSLPRISLSGSLGRSGGDYGYGPQEDDSAYVQLGLEWTLFDGGAAASEAARLESAAKELLHEIGSLCAQIRQEAVQAEIRLKSAEARFAVAEGQVGDAREDYRLALRRYEAQVGTNLDVLDSRAALTESRRAYVNAVYDIALAQCGLVFAVGGDIPPEGLF
jgi:outer membrane protein TolC